MDTTRMALTTHDVGRGYQDDDGLHDETSDYHSTDSEEGVAVGEYTNRWYALKRRSKRDLCEDLIQVVEDKVSRCAKDNKGEYIQVKKGDSKRDWVINRGPMMMLSIAVILSVTGLFLDDTSACAVSYSIMSLVMTIGQSYYLVQIMRDCSVKPHSHSDAMAPEIHFLAGNVPESFAVTRIASTIGFVLGLLGVLFAVLFMDIRIDTKFYMMLSTLFVLTTGLAEWVRRRDAFDATIWRDEILSHHVQRSVMSSRVEHALRNIHNGQTHTSIMLKAIFFFTGVGCIVILLLMFLWFSVQTKHVGLMFGLTAFMLGLGWFFGKWVNRSIADSYAKVKADTHFHSWVLPIFCTCVVAMVVVVFTVLDFEGFHRKFTLLVALLCLLNACLNFSKVAHKQANIRLLLETLEKRLNTKLKFGDPSEMYQQLFSAQAGGPPSGPHGGPPSGYGGGPGYSGGGGGGGGGFGGADPYAGQQYQNDPYGGQQYQGGYGQDMSQHG